MKRSPLLLLIALASIAAVPAQAPRPAVAAWDAAAMAFVRNDGQWPADVRYRARFGYCQVDVATDGWTLVQRQGASRSVVRLAVADARGCAVEGEGPPCHERSYFLGNDPDRWRTAVPAFAGVRWRGVKPGIDVVLRGSEGTLKYDVLVASGAALADLHFTVAGHEALAIEPDGSLVAKAGCGDIRQPAPRCMEGDATMPGSFELLDGHRFRIRVPRWSGAGALLIDPELLFGTYLGGAASDAVYGYAEHRPGVITLGGRAASTDFPTTPGAFDDSHNGRDDLFVARIDLTQDPARVVYATYIGGSLGEWPASSHTLDVAPDGVITMAGDSSSVDFPISLRTYQPFNRGNADCVVFRLDPTASGRQQLVYSTYLGGNGYDYPAAMVRLDGSRIAIVGETSSLDLPTSPGALQAALAGREDGFFAVLDTSLPSSAQLEFGTYYGGSRIDNVRGGCVLADGRMVIAGETISADLHTTAGAYRTTNSLANHSGFLGIVDPRATGAAQLAYGTYFGGDSGEERIRGLGVLADGSLVVGGIIVNFVAGYDFPTTPDALSRTLGGRSDYFVARFDPARVGAAQLVYATYLGGSDLEELHEMHAKPSGIATLVGAVSSDFPRTPGASLPATSWVITQLDIPRSRLLYSGPCGARTPTAFLGIEYDEQGNVALVGQTTGALPVTPDAPQPTYAGGYDGFVLRYDMLLSGLLRFGRASPRCAEAGRLRGTEMPRLGATSFELLATGVPPRSAGAIVLGTSRLAAPIPLLGVELLVDPVGAVLVPASTTALERADVPLGIPAMPELAGATLHAHAIWAEPAASRCGGAALRASHGLAITIQR